MSKKEHSFGLWASPVSAKKLASGSLRFNTIKSFKDKVFWCEQRANEAGRGVIMVWQANQGVSELLPTPFSARSKVHEYGGGEFCIAKNDIYFVNGEDQQIYLLKPDQEVQQITNAPNFRFADLEYDETNHRIIAVAENHIEGNKFPLNQLVLIGLSDDEIGGIGILSDSHDFYACPRLSPNGEQLVWLQWNLPHMPWQTAELVVSPLHEGQLKPSHISGGNDSACFQPTWSTKGELFYINDQSGTGQLYIWSQEKNTIEHISPNNSDAIRPLWVFGMGSFAITDNNSIIVSAYEKGDRQLYRTTEAQLDILKINAQSIESIVPCNNNIAGIITTHYMAPFIGLVDTTTLKVNVIRSSSELTIDKEQISRGELKQFTNDSNEAVFGIYYPPTNANYIGKIGSLPPAIITIHGGPTGMADRGLKLKTQYWTSRGFAVFDVDYSGSSGYGVAYRQRLDGKWGNQDVDDIIAAAEFLIENKLADKDKMIITGSSAGGYTCLMALIKSNIFKCASCLYPVTDLGQLLEITHKFEHGYIYSLTGTTPQNAKQNLEKNSVLNQIDQISSPILFFQGLEDKVVPPSQPEAVHIALKERNIETHLIKFEKEGHGFRDSETIQLVAEKETEFFQKILQL